MFSHGNILCLSIYSKIFLYPEMHQHTQQDEFIVSNNTSFPFLSIWTLKGFRIKLRTIQIFYYQATHCSLHLSYVGNFSKKVKARLFPHWTRDAGWVTYTRALNYISFVLDAHFMCNFLHPLRIAQRHIESFWLKGKKEKSHQTSRHHMGRI